MNQDESKSLKHHVDIERKIIHLMLKSQSVIDEMIESGLTSDFFDANHRPVVDAIFDEYASSDNRRLLSRDSYRQRLVDSQARGDTILSLSVWDQCFVGAYADINDLGVLKKNLVEAYIARKSHFYIQEFADKCKKGGFLSSTKDLVDKLQTALAIIETKRSVYVSGAEMKDSYIEYLNEQRNNTHAIVRCGIPEIDDPVNVGFKPQHLTLFVADVGGFKTTVMLNIALNLTDRGHGVLFIPLEMNRFDVMNKVVANRLGIITKPEHLSDEDIKKIDESEIWVKGQKLFHYLDADERTSVAVLKKEIENKAAAFKPKVVIIDYVDNLQIDGRGYGQRHIDIGEILKSLRFLGKKYGFHVISAAQMGRSAIKSLRDKKGDVPDSTSIHGSHQYSADSDTIFALMPDKEEEDKIKIYTIKARHGRSGQTKELRVDAERSLITSTNDIMSTLGSASMDDISLAIDTTEDEIVAVKKKVSFASSLDDCEDVDDISQIG